METENRSSSDLKLELIQKISTDSCSKADEKLIEELLLTDAEFEQNVARIRQAKAIYEDIEFIDSLDLDSEYKVVEHKIHKKNRTRFVHLFQRYAALLALPLLISTFILCYVQFFHKKGDARMVEVYVPHGAILSYELPDKSTVFLNSGSRLTYPNHFDDSKREVHLDGEGFFTVSADKEHPFYVHTPYGVSTYVYGTQFDVNAYKTDNYVETTLIEGKLNIIDAQNQTKAKLKPGDAVSYDGLTSRFSHKQVDVEEKLAWKSGKLIFRDTPLTELIRRLERRFNVEIRVNGTVSDDTTIRATFDVEPIEQILDYLALSVNLKWKYAEANNNQPRTIKKIDIYLK